MEGLPKGLAWIASDDVPLPEDFQVVVLTVMMMVMAVIQSTCPGRDVQARAGLWQ